MITLIKNAFVYAPEKLGIKDILIIDGKIHSIENSIDQHGLVDRTWDAEAKILTPGFIDQHIHLIGAGGRDGFKSMTPEVDFADLISCGTTTAVGLLGTDGVGRSLPALYAKTKSLTSQGLNSYMYSGYYGIDSLTLTGSVKTDMMFVDNILGCKIAINDFRSSYPTVVELLRKLNEVKIGGFLGGKKGVLHIHLGGLSENFEKLFEIVEKHEFPIEHISPTHVARTAELFDQAIRFAKLGGMIDITTGASRFTEPHKTVIQAIDSGVKIGQLTFSTDGHAGLTITDEMGNQIGTKKAPTNANLIAFKKLVAVAGFSKSDALQLVTLNPAKNLGLNNKGSIKVGADADFCIFEENLELTDVFSRGVQFLRDKKTLKSNYDIN